MSMNDLNGGGSKSIYLYRLTLAVDGCRATCG